MYTQETVIMCVLALINFCFSLFCAYIAHQDLATADVQDTVQDPEKQCEPFKTTSRTPDHHNKRKLSAGLHPDSKDIQSNPNQTHISEYIGAGTLFAASLTNFIIVYIRWDMTLLRPSEIPTSILFLVTAWTNYVTAHYIVSAAHSPRKEDTATPMDIVVVAHGPRP